MVFFKVVSPQSDSCQAPSATLFSACKFKYLKIVSPLSEPVRDGVGDFPHHSFQILPIHMAVAARHSIFFKNSA
eukprot:1753716-Amphidinium_carterae.3